MCASVRSRVSSRECASELEAGPQAGSPQDSIPTLATSRAANMSSDLKTFAPDPWTNVKPPRHGSGPSVGGSEQAAAAVTCSESQTPKSDCARGPESSPQRSTSRVCLFLKS